MIIKRLVVENFKSFQYLDLELGKLNLFIGGNASGKSNLISIFDFIRNINRHGLENAISMQGGVDFLQNIYLQEKPGTPKNKKNITSIEVYLENDKKGGLVVRRTKSEPNIGIHVSKMIYRIDLYINKRAQKYKLKKENIEVECEILSIENGKEEKVSGFRQILKHRNDKIKLHTYGLEKEYGGYIRKFIPPDDFLSTHETDGRTLLEMPFFPFITFMFPKNIGTFDEISIYDFDPRLPKKATPITGLAELDENGRNLTTVIKSIISDPENKDKFLNIMSSILPFLKDIKVEHLADKSFIFKVRESYSRNKFIPSSLTSDGTINVAAIIVALFFEEGTLSIFEEPERNIHPSLISDITNLFIEASEDKQIIVTTHNPEFVKNIDIENLFLIKREVSGVSIVKKPSNSEVVVDFLKNDMGLEELFVQGILEL